jgi:hypothetical protein
MIDFPLDPVTFFEALTDPDADPPARFVLNDAERAFVAHAFRTQPDGRLLYQEQMFSCPKKSGKTTFAGGELLYVTLVLSGKQAEGVCLANDLEQAQGRVFAAVRKIVAATPWLSRAARVTASRIEFGTGAVITAIGSDAPSAAGANPSIAVFDELWVTPVSGRRLWDELVPPPTRRIACHLTVTYAGFSGERDLLGELYKRGCGSRCWGRAFMAAMAC